jgi:hypothetical protein
VSGPFRFHGSTAGEYRWCYPTTLAAMELLRSGYFLDAAERCGPWLVEDTYLPQDTKPCVTAEPRTLKAGLCF